MRLATTIAAFCLIATHALAQTGEPSAPPPSPPPSASPPAASEAMPATKAEERGASRAKAQACRAQAQSQGQRGEELRDTVALCVAQAQLSCLKSAVDAKTRGPARRAFMKDCMSRG